VDAFATVRTVLAAEFACDAEDLLADGVRVVLAEERPGRRRFPRGPRVLAIATMGAGTVVSCDASRIEWARAELGRLDGNQLFTAAMTARIAARVEGDGQMLSGPDLRLVCAEGDLRPAEAPEGVGIEVVDGPAVPELYRHHGFRHALRYLTGSPRPGMLAAVARVGGRIVGVAGASADCAGDTMSGNPLPTERWASLTVPTLVMDGGASPAYQRNGVQALLTVLPDARHRTLEGQDHGVAPEVLAPVLEEFFAG